MQCNFKKFQQRPGFSSRQFCQHNWQCLLVGSQRGMMSWFCSGALNCLVGRIWVYFCAGLKQNFFLWKCTDGQDGRTTLRSVSLQRGTTAANYLNRKNRETILTGFPSANTDVPLWNTWAHLYRSNICINLYFCLLAFPHTYSVEMLIKQLSLKYLQMSVSIRLNCS